MLEEIESLSAKLAELAGRVHLLRDENQQLRTQLASANAQLGELRGRVEAATRRLDALIDRLPAEAAPEDSR
jgi:chromosome segregation ATPase